MSILPHLSIALKTRWIWFRLRLHVFSQDARGLLICKFCDGDHCTRNRSLLIVAASLRGLRDGEGQKTYTKVVDYSEPAEAPRTLTAGDAHTRYIQGDGADHGRITPASLQDGHPARRAIQRALKPSGSRIEVVAAGDVPYGLVSACSLDCSGMCMTAASARGRAARRSARYRPR
jgi:hypothetical protein